MGSSSALESVGVHRGCGCVQRVWVCTEGVGVYRGCGCVQWVCVVPVQYMLLGA